MAKTKEKKVVKKIDKRDALIAKLTEERDTYKGGFAEAQRRLDNLAILLDVNTGFHYDPSSIEKIVRQLVIVNERNSQRAEDLNGQCKNLFTIITFEKEKEDNCDCEW